MLSHEHRCVILILISAAAVVALFFVDPIAQDPNYHFFADSRHIAGISNFWNVASNLPFVIVGTLGLLRYPRLLHEESANAYLILCVGIVLVGFGSAYYHYAPTNQTLLWDRLPMTVAFMALLSLLLGERVLRTPRPQLVWILVLVGAAATLYWAWTESLGKGDLRSYAIVQFLPVLLIPLTLAMFRQRYLSSRLLLWAFGFYLLAKAFEYFDGQIFIATAVMSGHAIKHVAAAVAVLCLIYAIPTRLINR
ncbi:ceramidase domain-containing protein [Kangiella shandongensis]|uniref:ceramidase domain-containing protein n=1 Tax=Kangiella shandongensis TaxID=2763258 RepID=UPI001CBFC23D|nr:ceramidase domain-containing protein [Kangiella shandongensis]